MTISADSHPPILAFFAHPDDELSVGGTLARYASAGAPITLICATRGEAATIYSPPEYGATPENLGQVRTGELECCCRTLGIADLRWMDWPDGGVAQIDRDAAVAQIVSIIRALQPPVMITHPENGGYPHPDHLAVHAIGLAAWHAAADPTYRPDLGPAHAVAKLYGRVIPASFFEMAAGLRDYRVALNGQQLPFFATPDAEISTIVDVAAWAGQRAAGWDCHRSQHNPNGMFSNVSPEAQRAYVSREFLQVIAHRLAAAPQHETDLWAGLNLAEWRQIAAGAEPADRAADNPAQDAAQEVEPTQEPLYPAGAAGSADLATRLLAALRARRTYLMIYEAYRRTTPKADFAALLDALLEDSHEAVVELSHHLRHLGRSPMAAGTNDKVLTQADRRKGTASKLNFLLVGATQSLEWLADQPAESDPPAAQALWQELIAAETRHQTQIKELLGQVELAGETEAPPVSATKAEPGRLAQPRMRAVRSGHRARHRAQRPSPKTRRSRPPGSSR